MCLGAALMQWYDTHVSFEGKASTLIAATIVVLLASAAPAETAREILDRQRGLDEGPRRWQDRYQRMQLTVAEGGGSARHLEIEVFDRKEPSSGRNHG